MPDRRKKTVDIRELVLKCGRATKTVWCSGQPECIGKP